MVSVKLIVNVVWTVLLWVFMVLIILSIIPAVVHMFMNTPIKESYWVFHLATIVMLSYVADEVWGVIKGAKKTRLRYRIEKKFGVTAYFEDDEDKPKKKGTTKCKAQKTKQTRK